MIIRSAGPVSPMLLQRNVFVAQMSVDQKVVEVDVTAEHSE